MKQFTFRAAPLILVCCMFVFALSPSASAADYGVIQWEDLPHSSVVNGSEVTYTLDLMNTGGYYLVLTDPYYEWSLGDNPSKVISEGGIYQFDYSTASFAFDPLFFTDSQSSFYFDWRFQGDPGTLGFISSSLIVRFFDSSGKRIGFQEFVATEDGNSGGSAWRVSVDPVIPSGASSLNITIKFTFSIEALGLTSVSFPLDYFNYSFTVSADSVQNKQIQDKLNGIDDKLDSLPGDIGDEFQGIIDNEKHEANSTGNGSIDQMIQIIPDYSTGLIEGVELLAASLGYEGTECKLTMPALQIPALPGVTPAPITFMEEQEVDFEVWFNRMPSEIMAVTKAFLDIAVVIFCFIEFYDLISQLSNGAKRLEKE